MDSNTINEIHYGVLSSKEIIDRSVCQVDKEDYSGPRSVYDLAMGPRTSSEKCITCKRVYIDCPGHFGHIILSEPVINPLFYRSVIKLLKLICKNCGRLVYSEKQLAMRNCNLKHADLKIEPTCFHCRATQPTSIIMSNNTIIFKYNKDEKIPMSCLDIYNILNKFPQEDVKFLGYSDSFHPRNFVLTVLPVMPVSTRPFITSEMVSDDDVTIKYINIIRAVNRLKNETDKVKIEKYKNTIKFSIDIMFSNLKNKSRHQADGRSVKGIMDRLPGKDGLFRGNMNGRRINFSGRAVITGDDTLKSDEVGIPVVYSTKLTKPVTVTTHNLAHLSQLVNSGKVNYVIKNNRDIYNMQYIRNATTKMKEGDLIIYKSGKQTVVKTCDEPFTYKDELYRNGTKLQIKSLNPLTFTKSRNYEIKPGDIVERHLQNGDWVLMNRQPSLSSGSLMAFKVVVIPGYTLRLPLCVMDSFAGDFDGESLPSTGGSKKVLPPSKGVFYGEFNQSNQF